jgi:hypothetical protein
MTRKPTLAEMLGSPVAQSAIQQLAQGIDPRLVAAQFAGNVLTQLTAKQLGAPEPVNLRPVVLPKEDPEIIDAEFVEIPNSAPKSRRKSG